MPAYRSDRLRRGVGVAPAHRFQPAAPAVARLVAGAVIMVHGIDKLVDGPAGFGAFLSGTSVPAPDVTAWAVTIGETAGGLFLVLGLLSRWTALLLTVHLCLAMALVNADTGFMTPQQGAASGSGIEFPLMTVAALLVVLLAGPGPLALDRVLGVEAAAPGHRGSGSGSASGAGAGADQPSAVRASVISGAIGGAIGAVMSALVNYLAVGLPSSAGANAANHAVSGLISGFLAGFLGLLTHQRRHGPGARQPAILADHRHR
ncbi:MULTISPECIES: DoxX family protein [unclassified Streptomyces]|uniref:DoxX family protein n=1 Tax=unclassified Streptomyces TaxID=2593676 RepID=UPI000FA0314E|nr:MULTISPECIES: DoxX family protein [unclassified Streptomyces]MBU8548200.1 DoxX family protein [Streptomyces sp. Osf17]MBU8554974.1 DoxX family protein [Streptomyces sp. Babs14]RSS20789.1 DoxX family protein [Streptomyces sp. WAC08452]